MIKVWDYLKEYEELREEVLGELDSLFSGGRLVFGPKTEGFEDKFSTYCDSKYGIGVNNCTDALYIALKALGVGERDQVITVSNTAIPTVAAIKNIGAIPVFVDVNEFYLMNDNLIKKNHWRIS